MKSILEQLKEYGNMEIDNLFLPSEFDDAFVGFTKMSWNNGRPVYNEDLFDGKVFPDIPDGKVEPLFISGHDLDRVNGDLYLMFAAGSDNGEVLASAVVGVTTDDSHVIYDYDKLVDAYTDYYVDTNDYQKQEGESDEEYNERAYDEATVDAIEWIDFNTLRDYSYMGTGKEPLVVENVNYMFD